MILTDSTIKRYQVVIWPDGAGSAFYVVVDSRDGNVIDAFRSESEADGLVRQLKGDER